MSSNTIAVVIPCYDEAATIIDVVKSVPDMASYIIVVDDKCPSASGKIAEEMCDERVTVIYHDKNYGVGGAVISGYLKAMEMGCDIVVKMDGDGQMDPRYMESLVKPLVDDKADYAKGNRFTDFKALRSMPKLRLIGNNILSFWEKMFSGYWDVMDPTNGYTAIHKRVLERLSLEKISKRYFFESDMLLNLYLVNAVVLDIPMPARYGNENSSLNILAAIWHFPVKLSYGFTKRVFLKYFIYDFNMASVYILLGVPMFIFGVVFGIYEWIYSYLYDAPRTAGTIMISALPLIISFEMLLQAINIDIQNTPRR